MRLLCVVGLVLAVTTACFAQGPTCGGAAVRQGIGVDVEPGIAPKVSAGTLEVCWAGECRSGELDFFPSTEGVDSTCVDEVCSARVRETGGKHAFLDLPDLPDSEVTAQLTLTGARGAVVVDQTLDVTPETSYPHGPECGGGNPQQQLLVDAAGEVRPG